MHTHCTYFRRALDSTIERDAEGSDVARLEPREKDTQFNKVRRRFCRILFESRRRRARSRLYSRGSRQLISTAAAAVTALRWRGLLLVGVRVGELRRVPFVLLVSPPRPRCIGIREQTLRSAIGRLGGVSTTIRLGRHVHSRHWVALRRRSVLHGRGTVAAASGRVSATSAASATSAPRTAVGSFVDTDRSSVKPATMTRC